METGSVLNAIEGSHLQWTDFRRDVLLPFGIVVVDGPLKQQLPPSILSFLQDNLDKSAETAEQGTAWREQVLSGQGFNANSTVFPPNILPPIAMPTKLQRCQSPKMSREGLPRRVRTTPDSLFELPHAKPLFASSFAYEAFTESEHKVLPSFAVPGGTSIDFSTGKVVPGRLMPCPFLVFQYISGSQADDVEATLNMCAVSGAQCLKGIQDTIQRTSGREDATKNIFTFSCAVNDTVAVVNAHTINAKGQFTMSALCRFDLEKAEHFQKFQVWIQSIEHWACDQLLANLKSCLRRVVQSGVTPPASPMPSLTLSIDTLKGSVPNLMRALRGNYSTIKWHAQEEAETPIMSSVAACGTPWEGRKLQSLALASESPSVTPRSLMSRRRNNSGSVLTPIYTKGQLGYAPTRPSPLSPHYTNSPDINWETYSPCRPYTLSPCTPAPDMPWTAKSPMLVLQKRVEIAMDEIQELRRQMMDLQTVLATKNKLLGGQNAETSASKILNDDTAQTAPPVTCTGEKLTRPVIELSTSVQKTNSNLTGLPVQFIFMLLALCLVMSQAFRLQLATQTRYEFATIPSIPRSAVDRLLRGRIWSSEAPMPSISEDSMCKMQE